MKRSFAVTVSRDGEELVTIETNMLSGRELSDEDEDCIREAAQHLIAFVGKKREDQLPAWPSMHGPNCGCTNCT